MVQYSFFFWVGGGGGGEEMERVVQLLRRQLDEIWVRVRPFSNRTYFILCSDLIVTN